MFLIFKLKCCDNYGLKKQGKQRINTPWTRILYGITNRDSSGFWILVLRRIVRVHHQHPYELVLLIQRVNKIQRVMIEAPATGTESWSDLKNLWTYVWYCLVPMSTGHTQLSILLVGPKGWWSVNQCEPLELLLHHVKWQHLTLVHLGSLEATMLVNQKSNHRSWSLVFAVPSAWLVHMLSLSLLRFLESLIGPIKGQPSHSYDIAAARWWRSLGAYPNQAF